jgi:hypothetical protein
MDIREIYLGTQYLLPQTAYIGEELFSDQAVFNGIYTNYTVIKDGIPAPENDYIVVDGKLAFNTVGNYTITMSNDEVTGDDRAKVTVEIDVLPVGISESSFSSINIYPNPTDGFVFINTESGAPMEIKLYTSVGKLLQHVYDTKIDLSDYSAGVYLLSIDGKTAKIVKK